MSFTKLPSDIQNLKYEKSFIKKIKLIEFITYVSTPATGM